MGLFREANGKKATVPKICHIYPAMMKLDTAIPYLHKIQTTYKSRDAPLASSEISIFFTGNQQLLLYLEIDCILTLNF